MPADGEFEAEAAAVQARVYALMLVALDGQAADVEALLEDLLVDDLVTVVHGLAGMALLGMLKPGEYRDPGARARLGEHLRSLVLERQSRAGD